MVTVIDRFDERDGPLRNIHCHKCHPFSISDVADRYKTKLQSCLPWTSNSYLLARNVHAHMIASGFKPRKFMVNLLISVYCRSSNITYARRVFDRITDPDIVSRTALVSGYSTIGKLKLARDIFDGTPLRVRDTVFFNAMIAGYLQNKDGRAAFELFFDMRRDGVRPDNLTFMSVLNALALVIVDDKQCLQMHCTVVKFGAGYGTHVLNALISVYAKFASLPSTSSLVSFSSMDAARKLFDEMPVRDEMTWATMVTGYAKGKGFDVAGKLLDGMIENFGAPWNAMISCYVHHGCFQEALRVLREMYSKGIVLDDFTYTSALNACASGGFFNYGKELHGHILRMKERTSLKFTLFVNNALVTLYCKSGSVDKAHKIFNEMPVRDSVSWTAILTGYVEAKRINEAKSFFEKIPKKNLRTCTVMISGLVQNGLGEEAMMLFNQMRSEGIEPCEYVFSGAVSSCAVLGTLKHGCQLHALLIHSGHDTSLSVGNALITMYSRCGVLEAAKHVFHSMPNMDSVSWNAMIAALAQHGQGVQAIELFEKMLKEDIQPTKITFLTILSACSHAGLVEEGHQYFDSMRGSYGIAPDEEHYSGMIDLLCRAGKFSEAKDLMNSMPFDPGSRIWESILAGSWTYGHMDLCIQAAEKLVELSLDRDTTYIILSNMYARMGKWDDVARVRKLMKEKGIKKEPGCSWIEVDNKVNVFVVDDNAHADIDLVYTYLKKLGAEMKKFGYVPDTNHVLHDMEFEHKEYALSTHSEKLAVAFGLLRLPPKTSIRVFKNLRICGDCHNAIKFMSMVANREIIVRDGRRFHHFKHGQCSCGDYW